MGRKRSYTSGMDVAEKQETPLAMRLSELITDGNALKEFLGVSAQAINQYKLGLSRPSLENLCKIASYYGVSADYLLGLSGTPSTKEDIKVACKTTGLSEQAIEELRSKTCDTPSSIFIIPELNDLLISPKFWDFLYYLSLYRTQCSAAQSRPKLAENAKKPEDAARYRREGRKAVEDKDLFLFQMQKLLFSIASDVEKGCERRD